MKFQRQAKLLEIISSQEVETQEELLLRLQEAGFAVTQATISRDIKELRLVKTQSDDGVYKYAAAADSADAAFAQRLKTIFRESVTSCARAQNLIVLKTMPGLASAACSALDSMQLPAVVGTIAGDDTAFLALRDNASAEEFLEKIHEMFI